MTKRLLISLLFFLYLYPSSASAHSFGTLYNLPVPFWMYLYGVVAALLASFLVIGFFLTKNSTSQAYPVKILPSFFASNNFLLGLKIVSVLLFIVTILSGLIGEDSAYTNFAMTFFWILFVLGFTYLTAFIGNMYHMINPWRVVTEWFEMLLSVQANGVIKYPQWLGYYPSFIFYFIFIWIELFGSTGPRGLYFILTQYTMINVFGVLVVGKDSWFRYCEFFSVFFRLIGKIAPIEYVSGNHKKSAHLQLMPPCTRIYKEKAEQGSLVLFVLFMLSSTSFDGFRETVLWYKLYWDHFSHVVPFQVFETIGLLLSPFIFFLIYYIFIFLTKMFTKSRISTSELTVQFAFSLIPIAFVYNVAHYYTLIITEGQNFIRIISDPFGFGWNLFNTVSYIPNLGLIDTSITWHIQVVVILVGHIASVYGAHMIALRIFPSRKHALLSQIPMLILMVVFTVVGLWILAQPVTGNTL